MFYESSTTMSQASKNKLKRQSRAFSQVLYRKLSYRERHSVTDSPTNQMDNPSELSIQLSTPGILKIFGNEICSGTNYKSVLATPRSSAQELVKEALERYAVSRKSATEYLLCDVIGRFEGIDKHWQTECLRALGDNEKPLLLQDLWKPKEGFARRFELRRRAEVEAMAAQEKDTTTADINAQARKLQRNRAKGNISTMSGYSYKLAPLRRSISETSLAIIENQGEEQQRLYSTLPGLPGRRISRCRKDRLCSTNNKGEQESNIHQVPHLLLLQGYNYQNDCLVYHLDFENQIVGQETALVKPSICLSSPDILSAHCKIKRVKRSSKYSRYVEEQIILEPSPNACILINCMPIERSTELRHGDLIGFGQHYLFLFKNPLSAKKLPAHTFSMLRHLHHLPEHTGRRRAPICKMCGSIIKNGSANMHNNPNSSSNRSNSIHKKKLQLEYERPFEDVLISKIFTLIEPSGDDHKLTPACCCVCVFNTQLLPSSQGKTRELAEKQSEHQDPASPPLLSITELVPDLQHIFFWMSNSIELLYFIQQRVPDYIKGIEDLDAQGSKESLLSSTISVNEEVMTILEEVIMHTFQQCVYYITKSLYVALPAFLDCNPFQIESGHSCRDSATLPEPICNIIQIYQTTLDLLLQYEVHPEIAAQMFAYLFFFSNASLFNQLMDRGSRQRFFHWSKGEQMQASLRLLLEWTRNSSWSSLKREFHALNASQLLHILTHYQLAPGVGPVAAWQPTAEERETLYRTEDILLSFDKYPPIMLPTSNFKVDLEAEAIDDNIYRHLLYIRHFLWSLRTKSQPTNGSSITEELQTEFPISHQLSSHSPTTLYSPKILDQQSGRNNYLNNNYDTGTHSRSSSTSSVSGSSRDFNSCHELKEKLQKLQLQNTLGRNRLPGHSMQPLDPSSLLTPPNTPLNSDLLLSDCVQTNGAGRPTSSTRKNGIYKSGANEGEGRAYDLPTPASSSQSSGEDDPCCVFVVELGRGPIGLGMGLIDGLHTTLNSPGIYIRTLLPDSPAACDGRLRIGDRILAVNGTSLIGADYDSAVNLIRSAGERPRFLVAKSDFLIAEKISASSC